MNARDGGSLRVTVLLAAVVLWSWQLPAQGFCPLESRWPGGSITMSHNFAPSGQLLNGTNSWSANAASAMQEWSQVTDAFRFIDGGVSGVGQSTTDSVNNMVFDNNIAGDAFDEDVLAITFTRTNFMNVAVESDIIFNATISWNAYNGPIRVDADGNPIYDFRRVVLHELGHVLGLDHPDDACDQTVDAVMNARTGDEDALTLDDRNGVSFLYSDGNEPPTADAGPDLFGDGLSPFILNGGGSSDFDGFIVSYDWYLNNELIARGRVADVTVTPGVYLVELIVTDDGGAADADTMVITVGSTPPAPDADNADPIADAGADLTVPQGTTFQLDGGGSFDPDGAIVRYVWSNRSAVIGREATLRLSLPTGRHEIMLTVFDDRGAAASDAVVITVMSPASVDEVVDSGPRIEPAPATEPPSAAPCGALGMGVIVLCLGVVALMRPA